MGNSVDFIPAFNCNIEMPNGLQWFNNDLFVIDQKTDNVFILGAQITLLAPTSRF